MHTASLFALLFILSLLGRQLHVVSGLVQVLLHLLVLHEVEVVVHLVRVNHDAAHVAKRLLIVLLLNVLYLRGGLWLHDSGHNRRYI